MQQIVRTTYLWHIIPICVGFGVLCGLRQLTRIDRLMQPVTSDPWGALVFVLSAGFALALPIGYRLVFVHRYRHRFHVPSRTFIRFEKNLVHIVMGAPYAALAGYGLGIGTFHFAGSLLMAIYAVYYYYPSEKRLAAESRLFRVTPLSKAGLR